MPLNGHLMAQTVDTLKAVAARLGLKNPPLRKAEFKRAVEAHLLDARAGKLCRHTGGRWLAVPRRRERAFRAALRELGRILPPLGPATSEE